MKHARLDDMFKGWFVGAFSPTVHNTHECEIAIKKYIRGEREIAHFHKIAKEITVIITGRVKMMGFEWGEGDIVVIEPGEVSEFEAIEDSTIVVAKIPGQLNDKYSA